LYCPSKLHSPAKWFTVKLRWQHWQVISSTIALFSVLFWQHYLAGVSQCRLNERGTYSSTCSLYIFSQTNEHDKTTLIKDRTWFILDLNNQCEAQPWSSHTRVYFQHGLWLQLKLQEFLRLRLRPVHENSVNKHFVQTRVKRKASLSHLELSFEVYQLLLSLLKLTDLLWLFIWLHMTHLDALCSNIFILVWILYFISVFIVCLLKEF